MASDYPRRRSVPQTRAMETDELDLRRRLAEVEERIDRIGKRFTAGYGSDADRDGWLAWLRELEARRAAILAALAATEDPAGQPDLGDDSRQPSGDDRAS